MKSKTGTEEHAADIRLLALLVAKRLRDQGRGDDAPAAKDYEVVENRRAHVPGMEVRVRLDLGGGADARIEQTWWTGDDRDADSLVRSSEEIADRVDAILAQADDLRLALSETRAAARLEVRKARRRGLRVELISAELLPPETGSARETVVRIAYTALGDDLQPRRVEFEALTAEGVRAAFEGDRETQTRRARLRAQLDEVGATGRIDLVVAAALRDAGLDLPQVLRRMRGRGDDVADVPAGAGKPFRLYWSEGTVFSSIDLGDGARWDQGALRLDRSPKSADGIETGTRLSDFYRHPLLADDRLTVRRGRGAEGGRASVWCEDATLAFDADSGRTWAA